MQLGVELDGGLGWAGFQLTREAIAPVAQVGLARELPGAHDRAFRLEADGTVAQHVHALLHLTAVAEADAGARVGAQQAALTNGDDLLTAARERTHDGCAAADVRTGTDDHAL